MDKILFTILFLLLAGFGFLPFNAEAATLYSSLSPNSYENGTFILDVYVSSNSSESVNAVSGDVSFPQDKMEVISLVKNDSILDLWINNPSFSNDSGEIKFNGVVLDKKYFSEKNKIISIIFKIKDIGISQIYFSDGQILADDGKGTNILKELDSNTLLINN